MTWLNKYKTLLTTSPIQYIISGTDIDLAREMNCDKKMKFLSVFFKFLISKFRIKLKIFTQLSN